MGGKQSFPQEEVTNRFTIKMSLNI